jgi:glyoxylase-like metal-dependent hydrolase (beta-lactamase superfamily II)
VQVGRLEILPVLDGTARLRPSEAYLNTPAEAWSPHRRFLDEDGMLELALGGFLIRAPNRLVLVDTGIGPVEAGPFRGGRLLDALATMEISVDEISDVVLTHLHFDHVGWTSVDGKPVFERATYRCDVRDWEYFVSRGAPQPPRAALVAASGDPVAKMTSVADRLEPWSADGGIAPGINVRSAPGHTPGNTIMVISDRNERALLLGDVVHCPVELLDDDWEGLADVDPALARRTRVALAREIEGTNVPLTGGHFPGLAFGRLLTGNGTRRWSV